MLRLGFLILAGAVAAFAQNITISPSSLPNGTAGTSFSLQFSASGGIGPYLFTLSGGSPPPGLNLQPTGLMSGAPSTPGSYSFTIRALDILARTGFQSYTMIVAAPPAITTLTLPPASNYAAYSASLAVSGGIAPFTFSIVNGSLPSGLSLSASGVISGTPRAPVAVYSIAFKVTDADGRTAARGLQISLQPGVTFFPANTQLPAGNKGNSYVLNLTAAGAPGGLGTLAITAGALPPGVIMTPNAARNVGALSGVATSTGSYNFTITWSDPQASSVSQTFIISILPAAIYIGPDFVNWAPVGALNNIQLVGIGGLAPYTFSVTGGIFPPGLSLSGSGLITGRITSTASLNFMFIITAKDALGSTGSMEYDVSFTRAPLQVTPAVLPGGTTGTPYNASFTTTGGIGPYMYGLANGTSMPTGLTLTLAGVISGTPTASGVYSFTVTVSDPQDAGRTPIAVTRSLTIAAAPASAISLSPSALPDVTIGQSYLAGFSATGGVAPYVFSVAAGALPPGMTLAPDGTLSGSLRNAAVTTFSFTIRATDAASNFGERAYTWKFVRVPLTIGPTPVLGAFTGTPFSQALAVSNGIGPYQFRVASGNLPPGLSLSAGGVISGTPTTAAVYLFVAGVLDANDPGRAETFQSFTISVLPGGVTISPASIPAATRGQPYSVALTASGGTGPFTFSFQAGGAPLGIQLSSSGVLSGVTTLAAGSFDFTVRANSSDGKAGIRGYTLTLLDAPPSLSFVTAFVPGGSQGDPYSTAFQVSGASGVVTFSLSSGNLPAGLSLSPSGTLAGTPAQAGAFRFTVRAVDAQALAVTRDFLLTIRAAPASGNALFVTPPQVDLRVDAGLGVSPLQQCLAIFSTQPGANVSAVLELESGNWAGLSASTARTPAAVCVQNRGAGLAPGVYRGQVRVTTADAAPSSFSIPVTLSVETGPGALDVSPGGILALLRGPQTRGVLVSNPGGGTMSYSVSASADPWLALSASSGSAGPGQGSVLGISFGRQGAAPGLYSSSFTVTSGNQTQSVRVRGLQLAAGTSVTATQTSWAVSAAPGQTLGGPPFSVELSSSSTGQVTLTSESTVPWLRAPFTAIDVAANASVSFRPLVNTGALTPGRYRGQLQFRAGGSANPAALYTVFLNVLASGVAPELLLIEGILGPANSFKTEARFTGSSAAFQSLATTADGAPWLTVSATSNGLAFQANPAGRTPGTYRGVVHVLHAGGFLQTLPIAMVVPLPPNTPAPNLAGTGIAPCNNATDLALHFFSLAPGFSVVAGQPVPLQASVRLCDGSQVFVPVSVNGIALPGEGIYNSATWTPSDPGPVTLRISAAEAGGSRRSASLLVSGNVIQRPAPAGPSLDAALSAASFEVGGAHAPGSWIAIYGSNLAPDLSIADGDTFPTRINSVEARIGGFKMPLQFVSSGQINAMLPSALSTNLVHHLTVWSNGEPTASVPLIVVDAQPAIFTMNQQGTGQAAAVISGTRQIAAVEDSIAGAVSAPARRGQYVEVYCTGLGAVDNPPADGAQASATVLSPTQNAVSLTLAGRPVPVIFAGLTPGAAGLYQVNFQIPGDAPAGDAVPLVISVKGMPSNTVSIAIR